MFQLLLNSIYSIDFCGKFLHILTSEVCAVFLFGLCKRLLGIALERNELAHEVLVHIHDGRVVVEITAVVLGAEDGDQLLVLTEEAVSIFHDLVATTYQVKVMYLQEILQLFIYLIK